MMLSFLYGFIFAQILMVATGVLLAVPEIEHALFYTKTQAEVLRVHAQCSLPWSFWRNTPIACTDSPSNDEKRVRRHTIVHLRYTSPADGQVHEGVVLLVGADAAQAANLRPGDHWHIFAD